MGQQDRFVTVYNQVNNFDETKILLDRVTGVCYLWHTGIESGGLTVLLDQNGRPVNYFK